MSIELTSDQILANRLKRQRLDGSSRTPKLNGLARYMGAMQAQDYYGTLLVLGLRSGLTEAEVVRQLKERAVVRTWPQRGTLHVVAAEDVRWMTDLSKERMMAGVARRHEILGLTQAIVDTSVRVITAALRGKTLTRPQLLEAMEAEGLQTKGGRGYHLLWNAAQLGHTYIGPMDGKQQTFGLLNDLPVKQQSFKDRSMALTELARRYFNSHGPATQKDFAWWASLTQRDAKQAIADVADMQSAALGKVTYYWAGELDAGAQLPEVLLLPGFDEYVLGYQNRDLQLQKEHAQHIVPGGNGMFLSSVVLRGQLIGIWKRSLKAKHADIAVTLFAKTTAGDKKLITKAFETYGNFVQMPLKISIVQK